MNLTAADILAIRNLSQEEFTNLLNQAKAGKHRWGNKRLLRITSGITQVDLFCYLGVRFGRPKGILTALRNDDSDNFAHWHYTLSMNGELVEIISFTYRIEVMLPNRYKCTAEYFCSLIKDEITRHAEQIAHFKSQLEEWVTFLNPYKHLKYSAGRLLARASELNSALDKSPKHPENESELRLFIKAYPKNAEKADELSGLCLSIKMMAPVIAESFVNLLIFILTKPEIKNNEARMKKFVRAPIEDRLEALHKNCLHIAKPIDLDHPLVKDFIELMGRRNDLLHGNIRPMKKTDERIYFLRKMPLFAEWRSQFERSLKSRMETHTLTDAQTDMDVASRFIGHLTNHLDSTAAYNIEILADTMDLGYDIKRKILGKLLPDFLTDFIPADPRPDAT
jgi:hypothetical protein